MRGSILFMKKTIIVLFLLFFGLAGQSQVLITLLLGDKLNSDDLEFGLEGGINWTQITGLETKNFARKWNLGFYFDIRLKNQWFLNTGVLVKSNMGVDNLTDNDISWLNAKIYTDTSGRIAGSYGQKMNYFLVPALFKYKFKNRIFVSAGPQFGLMYKSWVQFDSDVEGNDAIIKEYNRDLINRIDVGIMAAAGYGLEKGLGLTIGVKYYEGFVNVYKNSNTRNRSFFVYATLPIGASEKAKQKALEKAEKREAKKAAKKEKSGEKK